MKKDLVETCRQALQGEICRLTQWLSAHPENIPLELEGFEKEDKFNVQAVNSHNYHQARERIGDNNAALMRIESGTYGVCVDCGREIPDERLLVIPYASRCVSCQGKRGIRIR